MVAGISSKGRRRITEGATKEDFGGHKCPPTGRKRIRELSRQNRDTQWKGWRGGREKRKSPPRKKPPTKKEKPLLAAPLAYGRLRRPPLSILFSLPSAAAPPPFLALSALLSPLVGGSPPLLFASPLALLSGGCAALPLPLLFRFSSLLRRLRRLTLPRALVGGWRRPPLPSLFPLYQTINKPLTPSHVIN